jgi:hypothetical protein
LIQADQLAGLEATVPTTQEVVDFIVARFQRDKWPSRAVLTDELIERFFFAKVQHWQMESWVGNVVFLEYTMAKLEAETDRNVMVQGPEGEIEEMTATSLATSSLLNHTSEPKDISTQVAALSKIGARSAVNVQQRSNKIAGTESSRPPSPSTDEVAPFAPQPESPAHRASRIVLSFDHTRLTSGAREAMRRAIEYENREDTSSSESSDDGEHEEAEEEGF